MSAYLTKESTYFDKTKNPTRFQPMPDFVSVLFGAVFAVKLHRLKTAYVKGETLKFVLSDIDLVTNLNVLPINNFQ